MLRPKRPKRLKPIYAVSEMSENAVQLIASALAREHRHRGHSSPSRRGRRTVRTRGYLGPERGGPGRFACVQSKMMPGCPATPATLPIGAGQHATAVTRVSQASSRRPPIT